MLNTSAQWPSDGEPSVMRSSTGPDIPLTSTTASSAGKEEDMNSESLRTEPGEAMSQGWMCIFVLSPPFIISLSLEEEVISLETAFRASIFLPARMRSLHPASA